MKELHVEEDKPYPQQERIRKNLLQTRASNRLQAITSRRKAITSIESHYEHRKRTSKMIEKVRRRAQISIRRYDMEVQVLLTRRSTRGTTEDTTVEEQQRYKPYDAATTKKETSHHLRTESVYKKSVTEAS
jgi:hypothetical protein